ncbi:MAG: Gfo/Idh/MocA family oxidoreductase [Opitutaceae bacterium]|nr:Gfo/Idh/MocA family oxidoreductase [Opitutaceae bacterium]
MPTPPTYTRRDILRFASLGTGLCLAPHFLRGNPQPARASPEKMRLAFIGVGHQGYSHVRSLAMHHYVAFADVDDGSAASAYSQFPDVPRYRDFRVMLERHAKDIDAVVISTPDHSHFTAALFCLAHGKHAYIEKPLTTTLWESRQLARLAAASKLKLQMGVQGHSTGALRLLREWVDAGAVGPISEVVLYTDRMQPERYHWSTDLALPEEVPGWLSWDLWLSGRRWRPYNHEYVRERWRNWLEFGTGPIGNIGIHMLDVVEYCLELGYPDWVEGTVSATSPQTFAPWARARWHFGPRGKRTHGVDMYWCDGVRAGAPVKPDSIPHMPREVIASTANAIALVGANGTLFLDDMRASTRARIFPETLEREFLASPPKPRLTRPKGLHIDSLFEAIRGDGEPAANLAYAGPLTEVSLLGNVAQRRGERIEWDHSKAWPKGFSLDDPLLTPSIDREWLPGI